MHLTILLNPGLLNDPIDNNCKHQQTATGFQ